MAISKDRRKELRVVSLDYVWETLAQAVLVVDLEVSDEEFEFVVKIIKSKTQRALVECEKYKDRCVGPLKK